MAIDKDMDISMDIHEKSVDMGADVNYHIRGNSIAKFECNSNLPERYR
jgi:hypothetical protein